MQDLQGLAPVRPGCFGLTELAHCLPESPAPSCFAVPAAGLANQPHAVLVPVDRIADATGHVVRDTEGVVGARLQSMVGDSAGCLHRDGADVDQLRRASRINSAA